jgi:VanZ family protein
MRRTEAPPARVASAWLLFALWASFVWWLGTDQFGAATTSRYLGPLLDWLFPHLAPAQRFALLMSIRKFAHPCVYAVLAGLAFRAALLSGVSGLARGAAIALALAVSLAGLDEVRQSRSNARTGAASDVGLDAAGASAALAALSYLRRRGRFDLRAAPARCGGLDDTAV